MSASLLAELELAVAAQDESGARSVAEHALTAISPSGALAGLAERAEAARQFDALAADFDRLAAEFDDEENALAYLDREGLLDRLEDDFALCVTALSDAAGPLLNWAIPLLSALAGPAAPLLTFGLQVACKLALLALQAWARKRAASVKP